MKRDSANSQQPIHNLAEIWQKASVDWILLRFLQNLSALFQNNLQKYSAKPLPS